jgi:hypothetical protein
VLPAQTEAFVSPVEDGIAYDVRVRARNPLGPRSSWATVTGHVVIGKTAPPDDVTGFSAAVNGGVVVFRWQPVADVDLAGYDIRYGSEGSAWAAKAAVTTTTRGTQVTTAAVPPGAWEFAIKAVDTSGNPSNSAATSNAVVTSASDQQVVAYQSNAPDWMGTTYSLAWGDPAALAWAGDPGVQAWSPSSGVGAGFVKHWTGVLLPDSTKLAADMTDGELWESFVASPESDCLYEGPEIDLGQDGTVRVWAAITSTLGPGETAGSSDPDLEITYRTSAGSYGAFVPWTIGTVTARYIRARIHVHTERGLPVVSGFSVTVDCPVREETGTGVVVGAGGTAITFATPFFTTPNVQITPQGSAARLACASGTGKTGFTAHVYSDSGSEVGGLVDYRAKGV